MKCSTDKLEALADGSLAAVEAVDVIAHAAECAECGEELRWLRSERELMRRRAARTPLDAAGLDALWSGVETRLEEPRPQPRWIRPLGFSTIVAAAAALAFIAGRQAAERAHHHDPIETAQLGAPLIPASTRLASARDPAHALDEAEAEWSAAAEELEQRWIGYRARLSPAEAERVDRSLSKTRRQIREARNSAGGDLSARVAVVEGYADYVQSLKR
jgi:hypothetical protein